MKKIMLFLLVAGMVSVTIFSCSKEETSSSGNNLTSGPVSPLVFNGASFTDPFCTLAHGDNCTPPGFSCLLRFPPEMRVAGNVSVTFYEPVENGIGETGFQMPVVFNNDASGIEDGILGPEEEGTTTIDVNTSLANALNSNSISVVNKRYYPVMDDPEFPHGYVMLDCTVQ